MYRFKHLTLPNSLSIYHSHLSIQYAFVFLVFMLLFCSTQFKIIWLTLLSIVITLPIFTLQYLTDSVLSFSLPPTTDTQPPFLSSPIFTRSQPPLLLVVRYSTGLQLKYSQQSYLYPLTWDLLATHLRQGWWRTLWKMLKC